MNDNDGTIEAAALDYTELTTGLVSAYVSNNRVPIAELPALIATTHAALSGLGHAGAPSASSVEKVTPAQMRKSITPDALISFEDGKGYKTLRRHLTLRGITPEAYREKWGLPTDYPMTAQSYSEARSALAKSLGLGRKAAPKAAAVSETIAEPPKKRGRKKATEAITAG